MSETPNGKPPADSPQPKTAMILSGPRGLALNSLEDYWRMAQYVCKAGVAPKGMERPECILIALEFGAELGLPPMMAVQNVAVINGRPSLWGDAMMAVARACRDWREAGFREWYTGVYPKDDFTAHCTTQRADGQPYETTFSIEDAKIAGLWGKQGPWTQYAKRMLKLRARGFNLRDNFADSLRGVISAEEALDMPREIPSDVVDSRPMTGIAAVLDRLTPQDDAQTAPYIPPAVVEAAIRTTIADDAASDESQLTDSDKDELTAKAKAGTLYPDADVPTKGGRRGHAQ